MNLPEKAFQFRLCNLISLGGIHINTKTRGEDKISEGHNNMQYYAPAGHECFLFYTKRIRFNFRTQAVVL
jgi:hypothetical protein